MPILEDIVVNTLLSKPSDPPKFILEYLLEKSGLKEKFSSEEKQELYELRK